LVVDEPPVEPPVELPLPMPPPVLGEELVLGDFVLEPEPVELLPLLMPDEAPVEPLVPPAAPLELEPDLLKCASHSERETCPSLFLSTSEKLGADELPDEDDVPPADEVPPEDDMPDELEPPLAAGEDDEEGVLDEPDADGVLEDEDDGLLDVSVELLPLVADGDEDDGLDDEDDDCATASVDSANSTAAVVTLRVFRIKGLLGGG
jgi:hypothetical protein